MADYKDFQVESSPPWMRGPMGTNWQTAHGLLKDGLREAMKLAVKARFPGLAPGDALDLVGHTLQIPRAFAKNDAQYVSALLNGWATWKQAGTVPGMTAVLTAAGLTGVQIKEAWYWFDGLPNYYFTIVASWPGPWNTDPLADGTWGSAGTWGDAGLWAGGIPVVDRARLKARINKWKPARAVCATVIFPLTGGYWGDGSVWGSDGTWGGSSALYINMTV